MAVEELGLRLRTDGVLEATNGVNLTGKAVEGLGKSAAGAAPQMERLGKTSKETAAAMRLLPAQITDVVTSLASGMPVWLVAIQQGGQIKDSFGGIGPAFRAITAAITPMTVAIGTVAASLTAGVAALAAAERETEGYVLALALTGNAAGITADQMADMARSIDQTIGTQRAAAEALAAMASTGRVAGQDLEKFTTVALQMERATGAAVEDTAKAFTALGRDPLNATVRLNEGTNWLTASVFEQIRALEEQGRNTEAARVAQNAFADAMASRSAEVVENLGLVARGWRGVTGAIAEAIDATVNGFRPETLAERMADLTDRLKNARESIYRQGLNDPLVARLQAEIDSLQRSMLNRANGASNDREAAMTAAAYVNARRENEKWAEAALSNGERVQRQLETYRRNNEAIRAGGGTLDELRVAREEAAILAQLQTNAARTAKTFDQRYPAANSSAIIGSASAAARLRQTEAEGYDETDRLLRDRNQREEIANRQRQASAEAYLQQLQEANERASLDLIEDAKVRGEALIELDKRIALRRLEAQNLTGAAQDGVVAEIETRAAIDRARLRAKERDTEQGERDRDSEALRSSIETGIIEGFRDGRRVGDIFFRELQAQALRTVLRVPIKALSEGGSSLIDMLISGVGGLFGGLTVDPNGIGINPGAGDIATGEIIRGRRAIGGMADPHSAYLVGENGPEVLKMGSRGGQVLTAQQAGQGGGGRGGTTINLSPVFNIDSRTDRAEIISTMQQGLRQSQAELLEMMDRRQV